MVLEPKETPRKIGFLVRVGAMAEDVKFRIKKFNGQKYQLWKMKMEDYLYQEDIFLPLGRISNKLMTMKDEE
jgi:energy-converting hydrogenase A subunit M